MTAMPVLETERLRIRPLVAEDLEAIYGLLDVELAEADFGSDSMATREARARWLEWTILSYEQLAHLYQPPLGERAVVLRESGELIGAVGYTPVLNVLDQLPGYTPGAAPATHNLYRSEIGIFYAISPRHQGRGYATEAARAMVDYAFETMRLRRFVATTEYDNEGSIAVMQRLGMRVERNPFPEPPWLQVVGILDHPELGGPD